MFCNDKNALDADLKQIDWNEVLQTQNGVTDVTVFFQSFYSCISQVIDKHVPFRKLTRKEIKSLSKPWVSSEIKTSIRIKEKYYKKYLKSGNSYFLNKYKYTATKQVIL